MSVGYDVFAGAFLSKITEFELIEFEFSQVVVDAYLKRAVTAFKNICMYDLTSAQNDEERKFDIDIDAGDLDELVEIISEGMVVQWLKPYVYQQELLQNVMNARDYTLYSPAELLYRVSNAYAKAQRDYTQMIREYSYNHGDLTTLHL